MEQEKRRLKVVKFVLLLSLLAFIGCSAGEEEIYLLPKGYVGVVYIIFEQKTGKQPKYANGARVYEIPADGVLKTQFGFNDGWLDVPKFYYIDGQKRIPIFYQIENKDIKVDTLQVCCIQTGNSYKGSNEAVQYERFFIGTKQQIDSVYEIEQSKDISSYEK